jgi:tRNA (guanine26-N2/guanine27-N2)-dimethyltransferase
MASDRDLNVAVLSAWRTLAPAPRRGWEMLAATGARGLRVLHESGGFEAFELTEHDPEAVAVLARNAAPYAPEGARVRQYDARVPLATAAFDYVDLDPYGTPVPFLASAFAALAPSGLLAVTATDTRVLAGAQAGVAERRYGGRPIRGRLGPESGLRLLLALLERHAGERGLGVVPRLAYVGDHHVRAYVTLSPAESVAAAARVTTIDPATWTGPTVPPVGEYGPMWLGPLFDPDLVEALRVPTSSADLRRTARAIELLRGECRVDRPFYYESNVLARELHLAEPPSPTVMVEELQRRGHGAAPTHARPGAFRTDATHAIVAACASALSGQSQNDRVRA